MIYHILGILFSVIPSIFIKEATRKDGLQSLSFLILAIIGYMGLTFAYYKLYSDQYMAIIFSVLNILSTITLVFISYLFFNEKLGFKGYLGIVFGLLAVYLLSIKSD